MAPALDCSPGDRSPTLVSGVVLAGGLSRRFGRDKARALLLGRPMIEYPLQALSERTSICVVVGGRPWWPDGEPPRARIIADLYPGRGPLGALVTALRTISTPWCLFVACDMPLVEPPVLDLLIERARTSSHDAIAFRVHGRPQPFVAAYSRRCLPVLERRLAEGELKMVDSFPELRVDFLAPADLEEVGGTSWSFFNVNTPKAAYTAEQHLKGRAGDESRG